MVYQVVDHAIYPLDPTRIIVQHDVGTKGVYVHGESSM